MERGIKKIYIMLFIGILLVLYGAYYYFDNIYQPKGMLGLDIRLFRNTPVWELAKAVEREDVKKIHWLIEEKNVTINYQEPVYGKTVLFWATYFGKEESVKTLLELGADPNIQDYNNGDNAIMVAYSASFYLDDWCDSALLKLMLKYGGNPNSVQQAEEPTQRVMSLILKKIIIFAKKTI